MLKVCYSINGTINISGSWEELQNLRKDILKLINTDLKGIFIQTESNFNPTPWDFVSKHLEIIKGVSPVKVSVSKKRVVQLEGIQESLEKFSSFLNFEKNAASGLHSHYEYFEGNEWIHPDSIPLIIVIK